MKHIILNIHNMIDNIEKWSPNTKVYVQWAKSHNKQDDRDLTSGNAYADSLATTGRNEWDSEPDPEDNDVWQYYNLRAVVHYCQTPFWHAQQRTLTQAIRDSPFASVLQEKQLRDTPWRETLRDDFRKGYLFDKSLYNDLDFFSRDEIRILQSIMTGKSHFNGYMCRIQPSINPGCKCGCPFQTFEHMLECTQSDIIKLQNELHHRMMFALLRIHDYDDDQLEHGVRIPRVPPPVFDHKRLLHYLFPKGYSKLQGRLFKRHIIWFYRQCIGYTSYKEYYTNKKKKKRVD